jgi:hypothetical protein
MTDAALSFACVGFTAPGNFVSQFTLSTGWHRSMIAGKHAGFSIYEANAGPFMFTDESDIQKLVSELPRIEAAMLRGLRRGKPPSRFVTVFGKLIGRCNKSQIHSMPQ